MPTTIMHVNSETKTPKKAISILDTVITIMNTDLIDPDAKTIFVIVHNSHRLKSLTFFLFGSYTLKCMMGYAKSMENVVDILITAIITKTPIYFAQVFT